MLSPVDSSTSPNESHLDTDVSMAFLVLLPELNALSQDGDKSFLDVCETLKTTRIEIKHLYSRLTQHDPRTSSSRMRMAYLQIFSMTPNHLHISMYVDAI
jgi:hypothetical protein